MKQTEFLTPSPLGDGESFSGGWARRFNFIYDKTKIKRKLFSLKEWDFFQLQSPDYFLQMTIGHVSYCTSYSATLYSFCSGERLTCAVTLPLRRVKMDVNPEENSVVVGRAKNFEIRFEKKLNERLLFLQAKTKQGDVSINLKLLNVSPEKDKIVLLIPFENKRQFYLNYKENCFDVSGSVDFFGKQLSSDDLAKMSGLLDWGRGVWPFHQEWFWSNAGGVVDGKRLGFNLGCGFGDLSKATENAVFIDNKIFKLGALKIDSWDDENPLNEKTFETDDGKLKLTFTPFYDNFTTTAFAFVDNRCHQVFGAFNGVFIDEDGSQTKINLFGFCEHATNNW